MVNAGATWLDEPLVHDGNLVTSRGPQDLKQFVAAITLLFAGADRELEQEFPSTRATQSAPPADEPPRLVVNIMRWMPKPSVRTILGLAVAAVAVSLYLRRNEESTVARNLRRAARRPLSLRPLSLRRFAMSR